MKETYINHIRKKRAAGCFNTGKSILLIDSAKSHSGSEVEQGFSGVKCSVKIIHCILTPLLLFLETHVNTGTHNTKVNRWKDWVENGEAELTKKEFARRVLYKLVAEWADDTWKKYWGLNNEKFSSIWLYWICLKYLVLHSRLEETIKQNQFPEDVIEEVNEFLEEIMTLQLEEESAGKEVTDEPNKNCIATGNQNGKGETNGHNDDIDVINLLNAKDLKNKTKSSFTFFS